MKKFDENYILLEDMVNDEYYPDNIDIETAIQERDW